MLDARQADGLVVLKLDRLTRNIADWQTLIDEYFGERAGKQLYSVSECVNSRTAGGRMILNIMLTIAQWEREIIGERTRDAIQHKISKGERCGRVRYGYDLAADRKTLAPNPAEQQAIALMVELRSAGHSLQSIADKLDQRGIPTKSGGEKWIYTAVNRILKRQMTPAA